MTQETSWRCDLCGTRVFQEYRPTDWGTMTLRRGPDYGEYDACDRCIKELSEGKGITPSGLRDLPPVYTTDHSIVLCSNSGVEG